MLVRVPVLCSPALSVGESSCDATTCEWCAQTRARSGSEVSLRCRPPLFLPAAAAAAAHHRHAQSLPPTTICPLTVRTHCRRIRRHCVTGRRRWATARRSTPRRPHRWRRPTRRPRQSHWLAAVAMYPHRRPRPPARLSATSCRSRCPVQPTARSNGRDALRSGSNGRCRRWPGRPLCACSSAPAQTRPRSRPLPLAQSMRRMTMAHLLTAPCTAIRRYSRRTTTKGPRPHPHHRQGQKQKQGQQSAAAKATPAPLTRWCAIAAVASRCPRAPTTGWWWACSWRRATFPSCPSGCRWSIPAPANDSTSPCRTSQ